MALVNNSIAPCFRRLASYRHAGFAAWLGAGMMICSPSMAAAPADPARDMQALAGLEKGLWEVRERSTAPQDQRPARKLCVRDMTRLLQINHDGIACKHFIVTDVAEKASITYQCNGKGAGRTDLRVETPRLVQIETQGISNGMPFSESLEARHIGRCR